MLRAILFISGILSFFYFLRPDVFPTKRLIEDTLGISIISAAANAEIVRQALIIHCLNTQKLPSSLNELYKNELSNDKFVDLDSLYKVIDKYDCNFELKARTQH